MDVDPRRASGETRVTGLLLGGLLVVGTIALVREQVRAEHQRQRAEDEQEEEIRDLLQLLGDAEESVSSSESSARNDPPLLGRVIDTLGRPIGNVVVVPQGYSTEVSIPDDAFRAGVEREDVAFMLPSSLEHRRPALTDSEGRFRFGNISKGRYLLVVIGVGQFDPKHFFAVPGQEVTVTPDPDFGTRFEVLLPTGKTPPSATIEFKRPQWKDSQTREWTPEENRIDLPNKEYEVRVTIGEDDVRLAGDASATTSKWRRIEFSDSLKHVTFELLPEPSILGKVESSAARSHVRVTHVYAVTKGTIPAGLCDRDVLAALRATNAIDHSHDEWTFAICPAPDGEVEVIVAFGEGTPKLGRYEMQLSGGPASLSVDLDALDWSHEIDAHLTGLESKGFRAIEFEARATHGGESRPIGCAAFLVGKSEYTLTLDPRDIESLRADAGSLEVEIFAKSGRGDEASVRVHVGAPTVELDFDRG